MPTPPESIADLSRLSRALDDVVRRAEAPGARVWVSGGPGSGRSTLARRLGDLPGVVLVEPPDADEADAAGHAAVQMAVRTGTTIGDAIGTEQLTVAALRTMVAKNQLLVLRLPHSWSRPATAATRDDDSRALRRRAQAFYRACESAQGLRWIVVADALPTHPKGPAFREVKLPVVPTRLMSLDDAAIWGAYVGAARRLKGSLPPTLSPNPLALRLAVGAVALGTAVDEVTNRLKYDDQRLGGLVERVVLGAMRIGVDWILQRYRLLRTSLPAKDALQALNLPPEHSALVTACVGYIDGETLRVPDAIRSHLGAALAGARAQPINDADNVHSLLADAHGLCDGAPDPRSSGPVKVGHSLERAFQLASAGRLGDQRWSEMAWHPPGSVLARARKLSQDGRYSEAVSLYELCVSAEPDNDYAQHYLAFNMDRAGESPERAERSFALARRLDPGNGWWNGRLVTFYVGLARYTEAEEAYRAARVNLSKSGTLSPRFSELAYWVATAWLDRGEVARARLAFDDIALAERDRRTVSELEARLIDAEEVRRLGRSVRPPVLVGAARWRPIQLPSTRRGCELKAWFGGRVAEIDGEEVRVVLAAPPGERVHLKRLSREQWGRLTSFAPEDLLGRFVEIGEYGEATVLEPLSRGESVQRDAEHELRYLTAWKG